NPKKVGVEPEKYRDLSKPLAANLPEKPRKSPGINHGLPTRTPEINGFESTCRPGVRRSKVPSTVEIRTPDSRNSMSGFAFKIAPDADGFGKVKCTCSPKMESNTRETVKNARRVRCTSNARGCACARARALQARNGQNVGGPGKAHSRRFARPFELSSGVKHPKQVEMPRRINLRIKYGMEEFRHHKVYKTKCEE
ncbi:hypothetical protein Taro_013696, partial [Colocasia esculenta]|nr:hypothetical protein [Colocasia esculenta]